MGGEQGVSAGDALWTTASSVYRPRIFLPSVPTQPCNYHAAP